MGAGSHRASADRLRHGGPGRTGTFLTTYAVQPSVSCLSCCLLTGICHSKLFVVAAINLMQVLTSVS